MNRKKMAEDSFARITGLTSALAWVRGRDLALEELLEIAVGEAEKDLICSLITRIKFLTGSDLSKCLAAIANQIQNVWSLNPSNTRIVALNDLKAARSDSAEAILWQLKASFAGVSGWDEHHFINSLAKAPYAAQFDECNFVFVDEFAGTGNTLERRLNWFRSKVTVKSVKIFVCFVAAMEASKEKFQSSSDDHFCVEWLSRGISDHYSGQELSVAVDAMIRLESDLSKEYNGRSMPSFGFGKSEALYSLEVGNTPNNVFPLFWWPKDRSENQRNTLLRRLG